MIRIGVIGAGPNAAGHVDYYAKTNRAKVIAVADPVAERAQKLAGQCGARAVADYHELLDAVDAVVIASPNFLHKEQAVACAAAGKHVYCEKPMGLSLADAREIAGAITAAKVASQIGFSTRFDPGMHTIHKKAQDGELGKVLSVCSRRLAYMNPNPQSWRSDHRLSGGLLYEINIHELDWMMACGGAVQSVYARTWAAQPRTPRCNDQLWITLNFASGAVGIHEGSWLSPIACYYRSVQGSQAGINTNEWGNKLYLGKPGANRTEMASGPAFDQRGDFLDGIEQGKPTVADAACGVKVMAVAEAVLQSAQSGKVIELSQL